MLDNEGKPMRMKIRFVCSVSLMAGGAVVGVVEWCFVLAVCVHKRRLASFEQLVEGAIYTPLTKYVMLFKGPVYWTQLT